MARYEEENSFPEELRRRGHRSPGGEWGWKFEDVPLVVRECERLGYAILGGQVRFILPDGTCEMYWLSADPTERRTGEDWQAYSQRTRTEFSMLFNKLLMKADFDKEISDWLFLKERGEKGIDLMAYKRFMMSPISEAGFAELKRHKD